MPTNTYTHTKDCPDRKAAAADRKAHDALTRAREQRLQLLAHDEWFDSGLHHSPSYDPNRNHQPIPVEDFEPVESRATPLPSITLVAEQQLSRSSDDPAPHGWATSPPAA